jgi:hypothetical protein
MLPSFQNFKVIPSILLNLAKTSKPILLSIYFKGSGKSPSEKALGLTAL